MVNKKETDTDLYHSKMDAIKSKMQSLSQSTLEASTRATMYDQEIRRINEIADRFEEQVVMTRFKHSNHHSSFHLPNFTGQNHSEKNASFGGSV